MKPGNPKGNQPWIFIGRTDAEAEAPVLWPPDMKSQLIELIWSWERWKEGGEGGNRGWDSGMASLTQWIWVWANSGRRWRTGKSGVLQSMGLQRAGHNWETKHQQILTCGSWQIYLVHKQRWIWDHIVQRKWGIIWWFFHPLSPHHCCPHGLKYSWMESFWTLEKNKIKAIWTFSKQKSNLIHPWIARAYHRAWHVGCTQ